MPTPWRKGLYASIANLELSGKVLDVGGSRKSGYHELFSGTHTIEVVNLDDMSGLDLKFDLEKPFPLSDGTYDSVLAFNVLEHIFNYREFLKECFRVLRPGGVLIIGVPFLIQVHPSPHDYWRYTEENLQLTLKSSGFSNISLKAVGKGPLTASVQLISGILRIAVLRAICEYLARFGDYILGFLSSPAKLRNMYPLGYFIIARK